MIASACAASVGGDGSDAVPSLPGHPHLKNKHFAGFAPVNSSYDKHLFYYFVEAASGNKPGETPLLLWLNGGPGASSLTGLFAEGIGPLSLTANGSLRENPYAWSGDYHLMAIDNPVGAGFSYTRSGGWVKSQEEMRREYYAGLAWFLGKHPEYRGNPLWITGESYAGKYIPNIAYEVHLRQELNLKGVLIGNGLFSAKLQYPTVPEFAFGAGLIDENALHGVRRRIGHCLELIASGNLTEAGIFCEDVVRWTYSSNRTAGGVFYYDVGMADSDEFDRITDGLGDFLNSEAMRRALHVGNHTWVQADEVGPVADALRWDFVSEQVMGVLEALLASGSYKVLFYNGVRDGSVCNHLGNLVAVEALAWPGQKGFKEAATTPWHRGRVVAGYSRSHGQLELVKLVRTGHLVPMVVPEVTLELVRRTVGGGRLEEPVAEVV